MVLEHLLQLISTHFSEHESKQLEISLTAVRVLKYLWKQLLHQYIKHSLFKLKCLRNSVIIHETPTLTVTQLKQLLEIIRHFLTDLVVHRAQ